MANEYTRTIGQVTAGVYAPVTTGTFRLKNLDSGAFVSGTHLANGVWTFGTIADGDYEMWNATVKIDSFGAFHISDDEPEVDNLYITAGGKLYTDTIEEITSAAGVTIDGVTIKDGDVLADVITEKTGGAGVTIELVALEDGKVVIPAGLDTNVNSSGSGATNYPKIVFSDGYLAPSVDAEYSPKKYVDDELAKITATPFQESAQKRRVIVNGTVTTNQVYSTIANAINSFSSPSTTKRCLVEIVDTGSGSNLISLGHTSLVSYVSIKGLSKHIELILGGSGASTTTTGISFNDLTIYMGAVDITTARTYNGTIFNNCDIYAYKSLTLTNCVLNNCRIFQPTGETVTVTGTTQLTNCILTNALTASGITGIGYVANTTSEVNTAYTLPADPTIVS